MNLKTETLETLSEKAVRRFLRCMPTHAYLREDMKQEAALAIVQCAPKWREGGGASFESFTYTYARRAMQEVCTQQAGCVSKPMVQGEFSGTKRATESAMPALVSDETPETIAERRDADEIVRDFIKRRMESFTGKGKLSRKQIRAALTDMISGDTCLETAQRYGCSKQRMSMLATQAGI